MPMADQILVLYECYRSNRTGIRLAGKAQALATALPRFADDLAWWTEAAKAPRARSAPAY